LPPEPCPELTCMNHAVKEVFDKAQELLGCK